MKTNRLIMRKLTALILMVTALAFASTGVFAKESKKIRIGVALTAEEQLAENILRELIGFESTAERPQEIRKALQSMAERLLNAGFPQGDIQLVSAATGHYGLVARYRGTAGKRPLLVLAHIDVVSATPDAWLFPPFSLGKKDGYYTGRGTIDNKTGVVQLVSNFIHLKEEGWVPNRDVIVAITGDEETDGLVAKWLANEGRHLVDAEYAINSDAGLGVYNEAGDRLGFWIQTSEKLYQTYRLTARNKGGHSSLPRPDNAIQELAVAITRLAEHQFPVTLNDNTKMELRRLAFLYPASIARDMLTLAEDETDLAAAQRLVVVNPFLNAMLHTTCVPTMLSGGHAENALPRDASVTVNCRIFPGTQASEIEDAISLLINDLKIDIKVISGGLASEPSELPDAFLKIIETLVEERWGDIPVIPSMSPGASDGLFFRNAGIPVFGIGAYFSKMSDYTRIHGLNERIGVLEFHESIAFWYQLLKTLAH